MSEDFDAIPDELKERDQWLMWDASANSPRRPHWAGDFSVSWSDPDDWHSYEEAVALAKEKDSWGIGYVFAKGIDDHPRGLYGALDLDGCVADGGGPKEWLPTLRPFFDADAYIERSPSGEGLHIPLVGFEPPEWWSNVFLSDAEHEGVEAYSKKFFTFTGDQLDGSADDVGETSEAIEDWLIEVHKSLTGEDPTETESTSFEDASDGGRANREEFLDEDDVREALDHIDPDVEYPLWRDIGFALSDFFTSDHTALSLFTDWSRGGTKWDSDAEEQAKRIIKDASGGGRTIGTVVHHARQGGWEMPKPSGASPSTGPTGGTTTPESTDEGEAGPLATPTDPAGGLEHRDGAYGYSWTKTDDNGDIIDSGFNTVCNFTLETQSFLETYEGSIINVKVHPQHPGEDAYEVQVHPTVFNDPRTFREELVRGRTTSFQTHKYQTEQILAELRLTVGSQNAPTHVGTEYIGLHGDEWVTPKGTLTPDGWGDEPESVYYEKGGSDDMESSLEEKWQLDPEHDTEYDVETVREIVERVGWTRNPDRGLPVLSWFYAAPLKPMIHGQEGQFNLLQVTGGTGTGKTSTLEMFYQLFGADPSPFGCGDKAFTIEKKLSSSCGLPIWLDEYKPTDLADGKLKWLHRRLRGVFREQSFSKGLPSLGEVTFKMRAPVVFSGEQTVEEAAVRRRTIMTKFSGESTSGRQQRAFCELTGGTYEDADGHERTPSGYDLSQHALAYYQYILDTSREALEERWRDARDRLGSIIDGLDISSLDDSELQGLQTIVFGHLVYRDFAESVGADLAELPGEAELEAAIEHVATNIGPDGRRREHIDEFTELVAQASTEGYIEEGEHFRVMDSQKWETEALAFHMPSTFNAVKRFLREFNIESEYTILGKSDYLDNYSDKIEQGGSYPLGTNQRVKGLENGGRAVFIDLDRAEDILGDGFDRTAFVDEAETAEDVDLEEVTAISNLTATGGVNPYVTVTVEVNHWDAGPDGGPAEHGTVSDETGTIDVVDFFGCETSASFEEGATVRIENARVSTYDGSIQLEIVQNTTEAAEVQAGVGYTEPDDPDGEEADETVQSGLEEAGQEAHADGGTTAAEEQDVTTDGPPEDAHGPRADAQRLRKILDEEGRLSKGALFSEAADRYEMEPDTAEAALEKGLTTGLLSDAGDGYEKV